MRGSLLALVRNLEWGKNWRKDLSGSRSPSYGHREKVPAICELSCLNPCVPGSFSNSFVASNLHSIKCTHVECHPHWFLVYLELCNDHHNLILKHFQPGKG